MNMRIVIIAVILCLAPALARAQPLSGAYTLGGSSPDFATFTEAAGALMERGTAGPVTFNVRAGTYTAGDAPVLLLAEPIDGVSPANRIVFQPDEAAGATLETVILERSEGTAGSSTGYVVQVRTDYVTLRDLTLRSANEGATKNEIGSLIYLQPGSGDADERLSGIVIQGCRLEGVRNAEGELTTHTGIGASRETAFLHVMGNALHQVAQGIIIDRGSDVLVEGNRLTGMGVVYTNGGDVGSGIELDYATRPVVRGNVLDYAGAAGFVGIRLENPRDFVVESNEVRNLSSGGIYGTAHGIIVSTFNIAPTSGLIVNNFVNVHTPRRTGIRVTGSSEGGDDILVAHNTVYLTERGIDHYGGSYALSISDYRTRGVRVLNNILVDLSTGSGHALHIADTTGNTFDYNVLYSTTTLVDFDGAYDTLSAWQDSTGMGLHSVSTLPEVLNGHSDPHLDGASETDTAMIGMYLPEVAADMDGEMRLPASSYRGADQPGGAAASTRSITGRVTTETGEPLADVAVLLAGSSTASATTDADGAFRFEALGNGRTYVVTPIVAGYSVEPTRRRLMRLNADTTLLFTASLLPTTPVDRQPLPAAFRLDQNYPNPFNPQTRITYELGHAGPVSLTVYDALGREVAVLVDADRPAGRHEVSFRAGALPSGVYFYRLETAAFRETRSMVVAK